MKRKRTKAPKAPRLTIDLTLGNAAMSSATDIAAALRAIASQLEGLANIHDAGDLEMLLRYGGHSVSDVNGNDVGYWSVD